MGMEKGCVGRASSPATENWEGWMEHRTPCSWEICTCLGHNAGNLKNDFPPILPCFQDCNQGFCAGLYMVYECPMSSLHGTDCTKEWKWRNAFRHHKSCLSTSHYAWLALCQKGRFPVDLGRDLPHIPVSSQWILIGFSYCLSLHTWEWRHFATLLFSLKLLCSSSLWRDLFCEETAVCLRYLVDDLW